VAGLFVAVGAVSGTVLSFEMGLLWPGLMGRFGDVIGHLSRRRVSPLGWWDFGAEADRVREGLGVSLRVLGWAIA